MRSVLIDTGVIVALLDRRERFHTLCTEAVQNLVRPLVTCEAVIAEAFHLLRRVHGAGEAVVANVAAGIFHIGLQLPSCAAEVQDILRKYRDVDIDLADACLIHLAGDLNTSDILTLDRDFEIYRWRGNRAFRLLIPLR